MTIKRKIVSVRDDTLGGHFGSTCPTVYETDRGTYVVKGRRVDDLTLREFELTVRSHETAVEIPKQLIEAFLKES